MNTVIVIAKTPVAGRVKTRLCPPCTADEAAAIATAALSDTIATVRSTPGFTRHVIALDGVAGPWIPHGFDIVAQRGDGLERSVEQIGRGLLQARDAEPRVDQKIAVASAHMPNVAA